MMPDEPDDIPLSLLEAVRSRDEAAARVFVQRLSPVVLKIVRAHRPLRVAEEDLCQEVFMSVFADLSSYRGTAPLVRWVSRVAVNTCYDALRRERVRPELRFADLTEAEAQAVTALLAQTDEPERYDARANEVLGKLLDTLPPRDRALMHWLGIAEESVEEVAERLGWSRVRVKVTAFRIRMKLRAKAKKLIKEGQL
jgi:RNA polymerase sigma factor (sigma-70 family)